ncbi:MAG: hypothetical protein QOK11_2862 [Pseudonocardiales bacterium]|nr:hypothetical protein [Pseudonocardiales bacterium]
MRAVPRGNLLRNLHDGSGQFAGLLVEVAVKFGAFFVSKLRNGWTLGVVSADDEPWAGQRVLYRETFVGTDPRVRLTELRRQVEEGKLAIPQPLDWRFRRKPPTT